MNINKRIMLITGLMILLITGIGIATTEITSCSDLQNMEENLTGDYVLADDIDCSDTVNWNDGDGFDPIGNSSNPFDGTFDGQGHTISDLYIDRGTTDYVGLFGYTDTEGVVENVGVVDVDITGDWHVGGLVGWNDGGSVSGSFSTGEVTGNRDVGGLIGVDDGEINDSYSTGEVTGTGDYVGGLVGYNYGNVSGSYFTGSVEGDTRVGGLVGYNLGYVVDSYSTGSVTGEGSRVGGLVGHNHGDFGGVVDSYATGSVKGDTQVGGLVGRNSGDVSGSYSTGSVEGDSWVGGSVGYNDGGIVSDLYWDTETSGQEDSRSGTGLTTSEMIGSEAETNMNFDFLNDWFLVEEGEEIDHGITPEEDGYPILRSMDVETQLLLMEMYEPPEPEDSEPVVGLPPRPEYQELDEGKEHIEPTEIISSMFYNPTLVGALHDVPWRIGGEDSTMAIQGTYTQKQLPAESKMYYEINDNADINIYENNTYSLAIDTNEEAEFSIHLEDSGLLSSSTIELTNQESCTHSPDQCITSYLTSEVEFTNQTRYHFVFPPDSDMQLTEAFIQNHKSSSMDISNIQFFGYDTTIPGAEVDVYMKDFRFLYTIPWLDFLHDYEKDRGDPDSWENYWRTWRKDMDPATMTFEVDRGEHGDPSDLDDWWFIGTSQFSLTEWGAHALVHYDMRPDGVGVNTLEFIEEGGYLGVNTRYRGNERRLTHFQSVPEDHKMSGIIRMGEDIPNGFLFHEAVHRPIEAYKGEIHLEETPPHLDITPNEFKAVPENIYHGVFTYPNLLTRKGENKECTLTQGNTTQTFDKQILDIDSDYEVFQHVAQLTTDEDYKVECEGKWDHLNPWVKHFEGGYYLSIMDVHGCSDEIWYYPGEKVRISGGVSVSSPGTPGRYTARLKVGDETYNMRRSDVRYYRDSVLLFERSVEVPENISSYTIIFTDEQTKDRVHCSGYLETDLEMPLLYSDSFNIETTESEGLRYKHNLDFEFDNLENSGINNYEITMFPVTSIWFRRETHLKNTVRPVIGEASWDQWASFALGVSEWVVELDRDMWMHKDSGVSTSYSGDFTSMDAEHKDLLSTDMHVLRDIPSVIYDHPRAYRFRDQVSVSREDRRRLRETLEPIEYLRDIGSYGATRIIVTYNYTSSTVDNKEVTRDFYARWEPVSERGVVFDGLNYNPRNKVYTGDVFSSLDRARGIYAERKPVSDFERFLPWVWIREDPFMFIIVILMFIVFAPIYLALLR